MEEMKYGEIGEICITGPTVMSRYLDNKNETDNIIKIHEDGKRWVHSRFQPGPGTPNGSLDRPGTKNG